MAYPSTIDSYTVISGTTLVADDDHASRHNSEGSAITALENKLGIGAGSAATNQILVGSGAGSAAWGSTWNLAQLGTPTVGSPSITGGTLTLPQIKTSTMGSVLVTGTVNTTHNLDLSAGNRFLLNMPNSAGSLTLTVSNVTANQPFLVEVMQGTAGSGTVNWFSTIRFAGSATPTLSGANRKDSFVFIATSTTTFDGYIAGTNI